MRTGFGNLRKNICSLQQCSRCSRFCAALPAKPCKSCHELAPFNTPNVARFGIGQARADKAGQGRPCLPGCPAVLGNARHSTQAEFVRGSCLPHSDTAVAARLEVHVTNEVLKNLSGRGVTSKETRPWILRFFTISAAIAKSRYPGFAEDPI